MAGHLVLVVHGIGEQKAGETVDAVMAGAIAEQERYQLANGTTPDAVEVQSDVLQIPQEPFSEDQKAPREMPHFPLHLRKLRKADDEAATQTTFADVFWADISAAPSGRVRTMVELTRTVLAVGYLAMENAKSQGSGASFFMVLVFAWLFFAGIASINITLAVGVGILLPVQFGGLEGFLDTKVPHWEAWLTALSGIIVIVIGLVFELRGKGRTQLQAQLARGLLGAGAAVLAYVIWTLKAGEGAGFFGAVGIAALFACLLLFNGTKRFRWLGWLTMGLAAISLVYWAIAMFAAPYLPEIAEACEGGADCILGVAYFEAYIEAAIRVMGFIWFVALVLCLMIYLASLWERRAERRALNGATVAVQRDVPEKLEGYRRMYPAVCSAMVLFWMVVASAFWLFVEYTIGGGIAAQVDLDFQPETLLAALFRAELSQALGGMTVSVICLCGLLAVVAVVAIARASRKEELPAERHETLRRVLLNKWAQWVLVGSSLLIGAVVVHLFWSNLTLPDNAADRYAPCNENGLGDRFVCFLKNYDWIASIFLLILAFAAYYWFEVISKGLGVVRDITGYATTQRREYTRKGHYRPGNFARRDAVEARFRRVLEITIKAAQPDRLTIISHSLGTVVATRVLGQMQRADEVDPALPLDTRLITMGSPVTHIYRKYFQDNFEIRGLLMQHEADAPRIKWINIFRSDDFVGTWISGLDRDVENYGVSAGGHPGYFVDREVWEILGDKAGLRLL